MPRFAEIVAPKYPHNINQWGNLFQHLYNVLLNAYFHQKKQVKKLKNKNK